MDRIRTGLIGTLALCLAAVGVASPAGAEKRPPARTFYLVNVGDASATPTSSACSDESQLLRLAPAESRVSCGSVYAGAPNQAFETATGQPCTPVIPVLGAFCGRQTYTADQGLPLTLDASRKITGTIVVASFRQQVGVEIGTSAGPTTLNVVLRAKTGGKERVVGEFSSDYTVTPADATYEVPFEIEIDDSLDGAVLKTLAVDLWNTGVALLHDFYQVNESHIVVPTRR